MCDMLGNHYFRIKQFSLAQEEFENVIEKNPLNNTIKKKLIICYTQTNNIDKALDMLTEVLNDDINTIIRTDQAEENCPCTELISETYEKLKNDYTEKNKTILSILLLFCDVKKSYKNFKLLNKDKVDAKINSIINIIENKASNEIQLIN